LARKDSDPPCRRPRQEATAAIGAVDPAADANQGGQHGLDLWRQAEGELAPDSGLSRVRHEAAACHPEVASNKFNKNGDPSNLKRQFIPKNPQRFEVRSCWLNRRYEYCLHLICLKHKIPKIDVKQKAGIDRIWRAKRS
jgi:hypothetical protein